jgi:hypothetical protein
MISLINKYTNRLKEVSDDTNNLVAAKKRSVASTCVSVDASDDAGLFWIYRIFANIVQHLRGLRRTISES